MTDILCRLCLNDGRLIDIFDGKLTNSEQLRKCILLGTGVEIRPDDTVTKYVCQYCSDIAIFLYRYRKKALANDKALKQLANEHLTDPLNETPAIVQSNDHIFEELEAQAKEIVVKSEPNPETRGKSPTFPSNLAVHPTVIDLVKTYPRLKIPNDLLKFNIHPRVALDRNEAENWTPPTQPEAGLNDPISDFERFKKMCPGIHITKVRGTSDGEVRLPTKIIKSEKVNALNKRKSTEIPIDVFPKKMRTSPVMSFKRERCNSSMAISETKTTTSKRRQSHSPVSYIEKQVPKLKISLRKSPDQSQYHAVIVNGTTNSEENLDYFGIQQRMQKTSRETPRHMNTSLESPIVQPKIELDEPPAFYISKSLFMESLSMQRRKDSPQESPTIQRSRQPSVQSAAIQSNIETTTQSSVVPEVATTRERITPRVFHRKRIMESDSDDDRGFDTEDLLDTVTEEIVINCGVCNKMFTTPQQLKAHERVHRCCTICKMIFRSLDALFYHQREICFKKVIANPPNLELVRVEDQPEMTKLYAEALERQEKAAIWNKANQISEVLYISDDDDDDVIIVGESVYRPKEMDSEDYRQSPMEFKFICRIFGKYTSLYQVNTNTKATETKSKIMVRYNSRSQIVLENMFSELHSYRVPVELIAKANNSYAYISYAKKPPKQNNIYSWSSQPVVGLNEKTSYLSIVLNAQSGAGEVPQAFLLTQLEPTPKTANNYQMQISNATAQTAINLPQPSITVTQPLVNETQTPMIITEAAVDVTPTPITVTSQTPLTMTQSLINMAQTPDDAAQESIPQPIIKLAIPRIPRNTYVQPKPSTSSSTFLETIASTSSGQALPQSVPSTSTSSDMTQTPVDATPESIPQPIIKVAIPRNPRNTYIQPKPNPSTSNSTSVPSTSTSGDMTFCLRVKTLSELL